MAKEELLPSPRKARAGRKLPHGEQAKQREKPKEGAREKREAEGGERKVELAVKGQRKRKRWRGEGMQWKR